MDTINTVNNLPVFVLYSLSPHLDGHTNFVDANDGCCGGCNGGDDNDDDNDDDKMDNTQMCSLWRWWRRR